MFLAEAAKIQEERSSAAVEVADGESKAQEAAVGAPSAKEKKVTSIFHGAREVDYKGRSWIERPQSWKEREEDLADYLPKR